MCSSVVPTGPFAAWGLEHKGGSDKGLWNPRLAQGALTAQEIDIWGAKAKKIRLI